MKSQIIRSIFMTLKLSAFFGLVLSVQASQAGEASCTAYAFAPGNFISGSCFSGNCNANLFGSNISVSGSCNDGSQVSAYAQLPGGFLQGRCFNGQFTANLPSGFVQWNGTCSNGGTFSSDQTYLPGSFINGNCQENGSFNAQVPSSQINLQAQCSTN